MPIYRGDLHVHTVLSPCAGYRMAPTHIVARAREVGLDLIAITDHNSSENAAAVIAAAGDSGLTVLPGMEVTSKEEVHVLALFDTVEQARCWQELIYGHLPNVRNDEDAFGVQCVVDAEDGVVRREEKMLMTACDLSFDEVVRQVGVLGGLAIPAHVDRPSFSVLGTLGFIPTGVDVPAVEVTRNISAAEARRRFAGIGDRAIVMSSDAHDLEQIGLTSTRFSIESPTVAEIAMACRRQAGRLILEG